MKKFKQFIKKISKKNNFIKLLIITLIIVFSCVLSIYIQKKETYKIKINDKDFENKEGYISVYLSGALNSPGVYTFKKGVRLKEALSIIGGIKSTGDISKINLSKELFDSEKIVIPYIQVEKIEENTDQDNDQIDDQVDEQFDHQEDYVNSEKININKADKVELMKLPGIGDITAQKIIDYRKNIKFELIEDIKNISGIGDSKFEAIKDMIIIE